MASPFIAYYLPNVFWPAELAIYGTQVTYIPKSNATLAAPVTVLWKDGASDEDVYPGRYSHIDVRNADLPAPPVPGDLVQSNGTQYSVVRVEALAIKFSVLVLQEAGAVA